MKSSALAVAILAGAVKEAIKRGDADTSYVLAAGCARAARAYHSDGRMDTCGGVADTCEGCADCEGSR